MDWIHRIPFYRKLQLLLVLVVLIPIIFISLFSYMFIKKDLIERIQLSNRQILDSIRKDLSNTVDDITYFATMVASDVNFQGILYPIIDMETINSFEQMNAHNQVLEHLNMIETKTSYVQKLIFFVTPSGFILTSAHDKMPEIEKNWSLLEKQLDYTNFRTMQWVGKLTEDGNFYAARTIRDSASKEYLGSLIIGIMPSYFKQVFSTVQMGDITLYDKHGAIAYLQTDGHKNEEFMLSTEADIYKSGWALEHRVSQEEITGGIMRIFYWFFGCIGGFGLLFLLLSVYMGKGLHAPILHLKNIVKQFASGNLDVRYPVRGTDEIAILGGAFNRMLEQIQKLITGIGQEQEERKMYELEALFAQIRPHFLLNTLTSFKYNLAMTGDVYHSKKMDSLMSLLRNYMKAGQAGTLQSECLQASDYLDIMNLINDKTIRLAVDIDDKLASIELPRLLLQPVIENSIIHGFQDSSAGELITIRAFHNKMEIIVLIVDNGSGISILKLQELRKMLRNDGEAPQRIGLANVLKRFQLSYGASSYMTIESALGEGTAIRFHIPHPYDQL